MKSKVKESNKKFELPFPKLMVGKQSGVVVLFYSYGHGVSVSHHSKYNELGTHSCAWNMDKFEDFSGTVKLSNE